MTTSVGINLGVYTDVYNNLAAIEYVFNLPKTNPGYMQVTRDMSRDKVSMILKWIALGAPLGPDAGGPKS